MTEENPISKALKAAQAKHEKVSSEHIMTMESKRTLINRELHKIADLFNDAQQEFKTGIKLGPMHAESTDFWVDVYGVKYRLAVQTVLNNRDEPYLAIKSPNSFVDLTPLRVDGEEVEWCSLQRS